MKAGDLLGADLVHTSVSRTLGDIQQIMRNRMVSRVVIVDKGLPAGIVTQKDIVRLLLSAPDGDVSQFPTSQIMSRPVVTAYSDSSLQKIAGLMVKNKVGSVVIVDSRIAKGILTKTDLCTFYAIDEIGKHKVSSFMSKKVVTASPNESVYTVAQRMTLGNIGIV